MHRFFFRTPQVTYCSRCFQLVNKNQPGNRACQHNSQKKLEELSNEESFRVMIRLSNEHAFQIFEVLQKKQLNLPNLREFSIVVCESFQTWIEYAINPTDKSFCPWKNVASLLPSLEKMRLDFSESRMQTCILQFFNGFEQWGKSTSLECLELDFFSNSLTEEQMIEILSKVRSITSLKSFSIHLDKTQGFEFSGVLVDAFEDLFEQLKNLNEFKVNLSCVPNIATPILLSRFLMSISAIPNLRKLNISLKDCSLNNQSCSILETFLEEMKYRLQYLVLDFSYNPFMAQNTTSALCAVLSQFTELRSLTINLKGADNTFTRSDYFLLLGLVRTIFLKSIFRVHSRYRFSSCDTLSNIKCQNQNSSAWNSLPNLTNTCTTIPSVELNQVHLSTKSEEKSTEDIKGESRERLTSDNENEALKKVEEEESKSKGEEKQSNLDENQFMEQMQIHLPLQFIRRNLALCTNNNNLIDMMIKRGPYILRAMSKIHSLKTLKIDILAEMISSFLS